MKKNITFILIISIFLFACSKNQIKSKNKIETREIKISQEVKKEKINLEYSSFKKDGLPLPINNYGKMIDYLVPVNENEDESFSLFKTYDEEKVLKFYKNLKIRGLGDHSSYWRWKTSLKKEIFYSNIEKKLLQISKANYRNVFTLDKNEWVQKPITSVGKIKNIKIMARGSSGIVTHLLIETTRNKFLVTKELNIRKLFATEKELYGAKGGSDNYLEKVLISSVTSLPSAHLAFEEKGSNIYIYGAGYGHGAGMPQFAASTLSKNGKNFIDILKRYYKDSELVNISKILGKNTDIKVGITSAGKLEHSNLNITSAGKLRIYNKDIDIKVKSNEIVEVRNKGGKIKLILKNGKKYLTKYDLNFYAEGYYISLTPIKKAHTNSPKYRGIITISTNSKHLRVINTIDIEKYLLQVVPSEMPRSFGLEALKAQAVAARTYAVSDIQKQKYIEDGFHIKDTVESQVYNNQIENEDATRAIEETRGKILIYKEFPIDAKYFSTSAGFTSFANDIW